MYYYVFYYIHDYGFSYVCFQQLLDFWSADNRESESRKPKAGAQRGMHRRSRWQGNDILVACTSSLGGLGIVALRIVFQMVFKLPLVQLGNQLDNWMCSSQ